MIVSIENISGTGGGWSEYTLGKHNNREKATLIYGDTKIGDALVDSINYKSGNYARLVLSFAAEDNIDEEKGRAIAIEFLKNFMHGYNEDEYHADIVEHTDTKKRHYHIRIPKINLVTRTQLKVYWHKSDLKFIIATIADIAERHNLIVGNDNKKLIKDPSERTKRIESWRENNNQNALDFTTKKSREMSELKLTDYIAHAVKSGLLNDLDAVKTELQQLGLKIKKEGYDIPHNFHYLTVQKDDKKIRLKGDIYDRKFYNLDRTDRSTAISSNKSTTSREGSNQRSRKQIDIDLRREREKRSKFIDKQYKAGRKRAVENANKIRIEHEKKSNKNKKTVTNTYSWSVNPWDNYRYLSIPIHNKIKEENDSIRKKIIRSTRKRTERKRKRAESIARINAIITRRTKDSIHPTKQDYRIIAERRRGRKLIRAVVKNIGTAVRELTIGFKRRFNSFLEETINTQMKHKKEVSKNPIQEIEKENQLISPSSDMTEGYSHIESKDEEVTIKSSLK